MTEREAWTRLEAAYHRMDRAKNAWIKAGMESSSSPATVYYRRRYTFQRAVAVWKKVAGTAWTPSGGDFR